MKEYKLSAWPDLSAPYHRIAYRRMLSDMSHRYVSVTALMVSSGISKLEVRQFLEMLADKGLLHERESLSDSLFGPLRPMGQWMRRTLFGELSNN